MQSPSIDLLHGAIGKLAHHVMLPYLVCISHLLGMIKRFITEKRQTSINPVATGERKSKFVTLKFLVSKLVPVLRH